MANRRDRISIAADKLEEVRRLLCDAAMNDDETHNKLFRIRTDLRDCAEALARMLNRKLNID